MEPWKQVIARIAAAEEIFVDDTWNWVESGEKSEYALVELEHCLTLEVPSVRIRYCPDEPELIRQYVRHTELYEAPGRRMFFALVTGRMKPEAWRASVVGDSGGPETTSLPHPRAGEPLPRAL